MLGQPSQVGPHQLDAQPGLAARRHDDRERRRMLARQRQDLSLLLGQRCRLHAVRLGQHQLIGHGGAVEQVHHRVIGLLQLDAAVHQQHDPLQRRPATQVVEHQALPVRLDLLAGLRVAVARHVDQRQSLAEVEEVELPRATGRV